MAELVPVGSVDDFEDGVLYDRVVEGTHVAVVRRGQHFYAFENACTHAGYFLTPGRIRYGSVDCPGHGAVFQLEDGEPTAGPAGDALALYVVCVEGNEVMVGPRR